MRDKNLAALSRVAITLMFSCLNKKPNKHKKAKALKLQYPSLWGGGGVEGVRV